jgi:hypothetical protein
MLIYQIQILVESGLFYILIYIVSSLIAYSVYNLFCICNHSPTHKTTLKRVPSDLATLIPTLLSDPIDTVTYQYSNLVATPLLLTKVCVPRSQFNIILFFLVPITVSKAIWTVHYSQYFRSSTNFKTLDTPQTKQYFIVIRFLLLTRLNLKLVVKMYL